MLLESNVPLVERNDLFMFDLDGVVYVGPDAVPGVVDAISDLRTLGVVPAFVTNNAKRATAVVAEHLRELGIECADADVVNSAQAAASLVAASHPSGSKVLALGGPGLAAALEECGLTVVLDPADPDVVELVTGFGPDVVWRDIMRSAARVKNGLPWTATNTDTTFPTPEGPLPGHGLLVRLISDFAGVVPRVAGKPERPLLDATIARKGGLRPLMVGDRLDTDIEGGVNAGVETLFVLTGVGGLEDLVTAHAGQRPSFICPTLRHAFEPQPVPRLLGEADRSHGQRTWELGGWEASVKAGELVVSGDGAQADWWRVVACAAWDHLDTQGHAVSVHRLVPPLPA